ALGAAGVPHGQSQSLGTPRRLIVHVEGLAERQPDVSKEMRGPSIAAAYDAEGNPTKALEGFCRGQGADPSQVRRDGEYVWVDKVVEGKATAEILATLLPEAIKGLNFEKAMRWGSSRMRFARPIRWLLASLGGEVVPFEIEGVASDLKSRGHRFYAPEEFTARTFDELIDGLIARKVEPDPAERETRIREGATINCSGQPDLTDALVQENVYLTEWPLAIEGSFKPEFLDLPESVLVIAMAKHEKFFPVRDDAARLTNKFISIRNAGEDETVRNGNAWVLNARFNDAKFFFDEDARLKLSDFLEKTSGIVFQEKLGTVRQRADRLAELSAEVMRMTGADEHEIGSAREAGRYAKADLSTGLVGELPALQGLIGGEYAKREGLPEEVCCGIASHYELPRNQRPSSAGQRIGIAVLIADQLDKLAGYLGLGLVPSGSSDPYGLRRAATHVIEAVWHWRDGSIKPFQIFLKAIRLYENAGIKLNDPEGASKDEDLSAAESAALRSLAEIFR
ncbi:MAG TPA: glycine--tRNA ligase subunit beta, partial [Fimbriimonadaceae bacterium]|nr:glycine--tRNA ligase subunit beta [Fimbriimonadaceae bacterium]